jgi:mediator of RNA polymerase II transcription subunit 17, fungi type
MMVRALGVAGVPCGLRFMSVGKNGKELAKLLNDDSTPKIGGEAILRIDDRYEGCVV